MPAGFKYDLNPMDVLRELCRFDTVKRLSGGVNFEDENIPEGTMLMPLTPLAVDLKTRKAVAVKNVKVVESSNGTAIKVAKHSLAYNGMYIGNGETGAAVSAIDKSNAAYDLITVSASMEVAAGDVLFESAGADGAAPKAKANFLNYAITKVEKGATVTPIYRAYEVQESRLYAPISEKDKETLSDRFFFIP